MDLVILSGIHQNPDKADPNYASSTMLACFLICKIVPAKSHAIATAKLTPMQDSRRPVQVSGYALGYMSLTQKVSSFTSSFSCQFIISLACSNMHLM